MFDEVVQRLVEAGFTKNSSSDGSVKHGKKQNNELGEESFSIGLSLFSLVAIGGAAGLGVLWLEKAYFLALQIQMRRCKIRANINVVRIMVALQKDKNTRISKASLTAPEGALTRINFLRQISHECEVESRFFAVEESTNS